MCRLCGVASIVQCADMLVKCTLLLVSAVLALCQSAYVDTLQKCDIGDESCHKALIQKILLDIGKTGIDEAPLTIAPIDPLKIDTITVPILGVFTITFADGIVKGVKDCVVTSFKAGIEEGHAVLDITCDINIKGKYKAGGTITGGGNSPFLGGVVRGDGKCKVKLEKLHLKFEMFYDVIRKDGEVYFKCRPSEARYQYEIGTGKVTFENLMLGDQDATELGVMYVNQNLKFILNTFGKFFFDVAQDIMLKILHTWFDNVPAKYFVSSDLTPYVKS